MHAAKGDAFSGSVLYSYYSLLVVLEKGVSGWTLTRNRLQKGQAVNQGERKRSGKRSGMRWDRYWTKLSPTAVPTAVAAGVRSFPDWVA